MIDIADVLREERCLYRGLSSLLDGYPSSTFPRVPDINLTLLIVR